MTLKATKDPEIKIDPRSGIHYYRGTPVRGSREIVHSLKVTNFRSAVQEKRLFLWSIRGVDPSDKTILFRDYVKNVFLPERMKKAPNTSEMAVYSCKRLMEFFSIYPIRMINDRAWDEYVEFRMQLSPGTKLQYDRRHLLMMLMRCHKKGIIREMPVLHIGTEKPKRRRVLTREEISAILEHSTGTIFGLALIAFKMGARPGEILGAQWREFDLKKGIWAIPAERVKTRRGRAIVLNTEVQKYLLELKQKAISDYVFPARQKKDAHIERYNKQWGHMLTRAGLSQEITPYYLRHTFLTEAAKRARSGEVSIVEITHYAGTSIGEFERTYLHIDGEDTRDVAKIMDERGGG